MRGINNCLFSGRLAAEPEIKLVTFDRNGEEITAQVAEFSIYVDDPIKNQTAFILTCSMWDNSSLWNTVQYLSKGSTIQVSGRLTANPYVVSDGSPRSGIGLKVISLTLGPKPKSEDVPAIQPPVTEEPAPKAKRTRTKKQPAAATA